MPTLSQVQGLILGSAVGDMRGAPLEFLLFQQFIDIAAKFENGYVTEPVVHPKQEWKVAYQTDDTDWQVLCFDSVGTNRKFDILDIARRGVVWYDGGAGRGLGGSTAIACWLMDPLENPTPVHPLDAGRIAREISPMMHKGRNNKQAYNIWSTPSNGPLMRGGIIGLISSGNELKKLSRQLTSITHDYEINYQTSELFAYVINLICKGKTKSEIKQIIEAEYGDVVKECKKSLEHKYGEAMDVLKNYQNEYPEDFGFGGAATTTMAIALESFFNTDNYEDAINFAINARTNFKPWCWDVDTYAAVLGSIAGCYYGVEAIPQRWRTPLHPRIGKPEDMTPHNADKLLDLGEKLFIAIEYMRTQEVGIELPDITLL